MSALMELIKSYPTKSWNWNNLSTNHCVSIDFILKNDNLPWSWQLISERADLEWDVVKNNPDKDWNWVNLSYKSGLDPNFVIKFKHKAWNFDILSWKLPIEYINDNPDIRWNLTRIYDREDFTIDHIKRNYRVLCNHPIHKKITSLDIDKDPNFPWNWKMLSHYAQIDTDIVKKYPHKPWDWYYFTHRFGYDFVKYYPTQNLNWSLLSTDLNTDLNFIFQNAPLCEMNKNFMHTLSANPRLTSSIVKKYSNLDWDWDVLSKNNFGHDVSLLKIRYNALKFIFLICENLQTDLPLEMIMHIIKYI